MRKKSYLEMRGDQEAFDLISSDWKDFTFAAKKLANHAMKLGGLGFGTAFLQWVAAAVAIYLLILDRTNILTGLLIPYIVLNLPSVLFNLFRGEVGKWIALIAVVLRLFFPRRFPGALILLIVVTPAFFPSTLRNSWVGVAISLFIACYLLQEHIQASGGFRNAFTKAHGISNSIGMILLFVYPAWALVLYIP